MNKIISLLLAFAVVFLLTGCVNDSDPSVPSTAPSTGPTSIPVTNPPTTPVTEPTAEPTIPDPAASYPSTKASEVANYDAFIYSDEYAEMFEEEIRNYPCRYGYLYLWDHISGEIHEVSDSICEAVESAKDHVFFSTMGGQLYHYLVDTRITMTLSYTAQNGEIRWIGYCRINDEPMLYLLDGEDLIRYGILDGSVSFIATFQDAEQVHPSPANGYLVCIQTPGEQFAYNTQTGERVSLVTEKQLHEFYDEGILPEPDTYKYPSAEE